MSETNNNFHMAIARAGKNARFAGFYERLIDEGRRILHLHFDYIELTRDGRLLSDEHEDMIDRLAHLHTRQFRHNFLDFLRLNYSSGVELDPR